jgi:hypothetical protein
VVGWGIGKLLEPNGCGRIDVPFQYFYEEVEENSKKTRAVSSLDSKSPPPEYNSIPIYP